MIPVPKPALPVYDEDYRDFIRAHPCHICCLTTGKPVPSFSEACHVQSRGVRAGDAQNLYPACASHHREQHAKGVLTFQRKYGVSLKRIAGTYWRQYRAEPKLF